MGSAPLFIENGSLSYFFPMLFPLKKEKKTEQLKSHKCNLILVSKIKTIGIHLEETMVGRTVNFRFDNGNGLSPDASLSVDVTFTGAHTTMIQCDSCVRESSSKVA